MSDDLEEFIQAQKVKLAHARKTHGIKSPEIQVPKLATNAQPPRTAGYFGSNPQGAPEPDYFTAPPAVSNQFPPGRDEGLKLGEYDEKKRLYREQRKAETRDFFAKDKRQSRKPTRDAPPVAQNRGTSMPFQDDVVAKRQKEFERNREYNEFLSNKVGMGQPRTRPTEEIPGSFFPDPDKENEARLRNERNREYNDYLRRKQEHERLKKAGGNVDESAGGVTSDAKPIVYQPVYHEGQNAPRYVMPAVAPPAQMPNYEEMLRQKAEEERKYRQPPPAVSMAPQFVPQYMVPQQSLGGYQQPGPQSQGQRVRRLPPVEDLEARMQTYDFELGKRKQMLKEDHRNSNLNISLNQYSSDPSLNMLESGKYMNGDMFLDEQLMGHFGKMREDPPMRFDDMPSANYGAPPPQMQQMAAPNRLTEGGGGGFSGPSGSIAPPSGPAPGGPPDPQYEKKKKQQEYKKALVAQMHAQEAARKIEKEKNLQINLTGDKDASKLQMGYMRSGGGVGEYPFPQQQQQQQQRPPGVSKLPLDGSNQLISRPLDLWSTGNAAAPSFDATYNYFANADPLDPMVAPRGLLGLDVANANAGGSQAYQAELLKQMREKQDKEYRQKLEHERWEKKKDAEDSYFPFGKGGAGAPLRDADGNIIADLRELHHIAETNKQPSVRNEYHGQLTETLSARPNEHYSGAPVSSRDPAAPQFARGKIFNDPIPKHQLTQQEQYKLDLKRQMEEKQNEKDLARKKQAEEDEKEEARIREQMSQIQAEYEKEQEKIRMKAEEQQKKNEEMRQEAEQKRLALERARKEEEEKRSEERRKDMERELEERRRAEQAKKPASPPLPAQKKAAPVPVQDPRPAPQSKTVTPAAPGGGAKSVNIPSHPVRLVKGKTTGRDQSRAEVNRQLSAMRQQLMSEQRRIEMQIENKNYRLADGPKPDKKRVDAVFDKNIKGPNDVDHYGFSKHDVRPPRQPSTDMILTEPAKVRRPTQLESWNPIFKDEPNEAALDLFLHSKYDPLTRSRDNFRQQFPNAPRSSDMLEVQQQELIRQQERELLRLRKGDPGSDLAEIREDDLNFLIDHPDAKSMPLASDSAYIGINGDTLIPTPPLMTKIERMRDRRRMEPEKPATPPDNTNGPKLKDFLPSPPSSAGGSTKPKISHQLSNNVFEIPDVEDVNLPFEPFQVEKSFAKNDDAEKQLPNPDTLSLGSNFSFDVDAVARKNKERLRKLENSNDVDTLSIADPDEVLRKFVDHDFNPKAVRPMSTMTNDTDPDWLKPS